MPKFLNQKGPACRQAGLAPIIIIIIVGVAIMLIGVGIYNNSDCVTLTERSENRNISSCIINYLSGITKRNSGNGLSNPGKTEPKNNSQSSNSTTQPGPFSKNETAKKPLSCDSIDIVPGYGYSEKAGGESDMTYENICKDKLCSGTLGIIDGAYVGGKDPTGTSYSRSSTRYRFSQRGNIIFSCGMRFASSKSFTDTISWYKSKLDWMGTAQEKTEAVGGPPRKQSAWTYEKCYGGKVYQYTLTIIENKDESYNPVEMTLAYDEFQDEDQVGYNKPVGEGCITQEEWDKRFQNKLQDILNSK